MESILLVEDDPQVSESLRSFLAQKGYPVVTAENGLDAIEKIGALKPGLVLLDLMMPVMNGWEFLEAKELQSALTKIPVLVLSAVAGSPRIPGAMGFLKKPVDLNRLLDFVELYCS